MQSAVPGRAPAGGRVHNGPADVGVRVIGEKPGTTARVVRHFTVLTFVVAVEVGGLLIWVWIVVRAETLGPKKIKIKPKDF